ncbi:hypothetical protein M3A49_40210 [Paraburkholderia sp. CNPSo 3076]|uniref:hypothetical protein n=1 Tax=Paraburkholderia sp. CNPSo 3076 TaxID=2940936 RepID=UPI00225A9143|nr:hypothetical protein [Paraburkholderia sp. CNPSo 3076]MCX5545579.1 hypothetical protein [Paraburkholderia sp. CNPSo 3076]
MTDDPTVRWELANSLGIQIDNAADAWHSGHVTEILDLVADDLLVVATQTGGVWSVDPNYGGAHPLSDTWDDPDISCLAFGPDGTVHLFAGSSGQLPTSPTRSISTIRETDVGTAAPLANWNPIDAQLPSGAGSITRIAVLPRARRIVVACNKLLTDDSGGIFWSIIPESSLGPAPPPRPPYLWHKARVRGGPNDGFYDVTFATLTDGTPLSSVEVLDQVTVVAGAMSQGIYVGQWNAVGDLVLQPVQQTSSTNPNITVLSTAGACSVAACAVHPNRAYAACAASDGTLLQILRSGDGGRVWEACPFTLAGSTVFGGIQSAAGDQGNAWNNRIAVAPDIFSVVAFGWQSAGPFLSTDAGQNWIQVTDPVHLHSDLHALLFTRLRGSVDLMLCVGSDGGVASINVDQFLKGGGPEARSNFNHNLPTLQLYSNLIRQFYGSIAAAPLQQRLVAAGAQDHGNLCNNLALGSTSPTTGLPEPQPWTHVDYGDGGWVAFITDGALLHNINSGPIAATVINPPLGPQDFGVVAVGGTPPDPKGIAGATGEIVTHPSYRNTTGDLLLAVAGVGNIVYGLYTDHTLWPPPPLSILGTFPMRHYWNVLATLPVGVVAGAFASFDGVSVFVGTWNDGRMFQVDSAQGTVVELPVVLPQPSPGNPMTGGSVIRIVAFSDAVLFAILDGASAKLNPAVTANYILQLDSANARWVPTPGAGLPNEPLFGLETVEVPRSRVPHALFVCTDDQVYISRDDGQTWQGASLNLPSRPHCGDLRFCVGPNGGVLYLGTFGRSMWQAPIVSLP